MLARVAATLSPSGMRRSSPLPLITKVGLSLIARRDRRAVPQAQTRSGRGTNSRKTMAEPKKGASVKDDGAMRVDAALVQELAELLTANALTEIEVGDGDRRIPVARHATPAPPPPFSTAPPPAP